MHEVYVDCPVKLKNVQKFVLKFQKLIKYLKKKN